VGWRERAAQREQAAQRERAAPPGRGAPLRLVRAVAVPEHSLEQLSPILQA
jgi:hypothetical protein